MAIHYYEQEAKSDLSQKRALSNYLAALIKKHLDNVKIISLSYVFCNDEHLLSINKDFLNHNTYTDIITFDLSENDTELIGEIYISIERVKENADKFRTLYNEELHRVIFHGALHLCGFKDKTKKDKEAMRNAENKCLREYWGEGKR